MNKRVIGATKRQKEILDFVRAFIRVKGYPPTRQEIADAFDLFPNGVQQHLVALKVKGLLQIIPNVSRGIVPAPSSIHSPNRWLAILRAA